MDFPAITTQGVWLLKIPIKLLRSPAKKNTPIHWGIKRFSKPKGNTFKMPGLPVHDTDYFSGRSFEFRHWKKTGSRHTAC